MFFEAKHLIFKDKEPERFTELDAPDWITSADTTAGSTMDNRWFWK